MPASMFCTIEDVRQQMRTETGFVGDDPLILSSIKQATSMIRQFTRREWTVAEYTDYLDTVDIDTGIRRGRGVYILSLREKPLDLRDAFYPKLRYSASGRWDDTDDIDRKHYVADGRKNQIILYPGVMDHRPRSMRVVYRAGFLTDDMVNDGGDEELVHVSQQLRDACLFQSVYFVRRELNVTAGTSRDGEQSKLRGYWVTPSGLVREAVALLRTEGRVLVGGNT